MIVYIYININKSDSSQSLKWLESHSSQSLKWLESHSSQSLKWLELHSSQSLKWLELLSIPYLTWITLKSIEMQVNSLECDVRVCSVLQNVAVCCSVLQCVPDASQFPRMWFKSLQRVAACCSMLQSVALYCSVFQTQVNSLECDWSQSTWLWIWQQSFGSHVKWLESDLRISSEMT